jgi:outer membrane protein assembly factor BamB
VAVTTRDDAGEPPSTALRAVGTDGAERWTVTVSGEVDAAPAVADGTVYTATVDGTLHAVDTDGTERWSTAVPGRVLSSPAVADGRVYVGTFEDGLYAIDVSDGTTAWRTEATLLYTDPVVTDGALVVGGQRVQARDRADGSIRWSYDMFLGGHEEYTSPAVVDGQVLVGACTKRKRHQARYDNFVLALGGGR